MNDLRMVVLLTVLGACLPIFGADTSSPGREGHQKKITCSEPAYPNESSPCNGGEVLDDGSPESFLGAISTSPRRTVVQRFTPPSYPSVYYEVCVAWGRSGSDPEISYDVVFYDDDGPNGDPGTLLAAVPTSMSSVPFTFSYGFSSTSVAAPAVTSGSLYIGFRWFPSIEQDFYYLVDSSPSTPQQVVRSSVDDGVSWAYTPSLGKALFIRARSTSTYTVVPSAQEFAAGNESTEGLPFSTPHTRYQQVFLGSEVGARWISEIRFRGAWGEGGGPFCPEVFQGATVTLSTTPRAVDALSSTFSINTGPDAKVVYQGDLWIWSRGSTVPGLSPFDIAIQLQSPFYLNDSGNLLLDLDLPGIVFPAFHYFDTHNATDAVSRAYCADDPSCNTGDLSFSPDTRGLVTMFLFGSPYIFVDGFESGDTSQWSATIP